MSESINSLLNISLNNSKSRIEQVIKEKAYDDVVGDLQSMTSLITNQYITPSQPTDIVLLVDVSSLKQQQLDETYKLYQELFFFYKRSLYPSQLLLILYSDEMNDCILNEFYKPSQTLELTKFEKVKKTPESDLGLFSSLEYVEVFPFQFSKRIVLIDTPKIVDKETFLLHKHQLDHRFCNTFVLQTNEENEIGCSLKKVPNDVFCYYLYKQYPHLPSNETIIKGVTLELPWVSWNPLLFPPIVTQQTATLTKHNNELCLLNEIENSHVVISEIGSYNEVLDILEAHRIIQEFVQMFEKRCQSCGMGMNRLKMECMKIFCEKHDHQILCCYCLQQTNDRKEITTTEIIQAFCHFVNLQTQGSLKIKKVFGINQQPPLILDCQIASIGYSKYHYWRDVERDMKWNHKCNGYCKILGLTRHKGL